jgi:NAD(P)-dependent dehydrogenase (short-subunit alcohol dehydrogenase family)
MNIDLSGKTALVTGGSKGIGRETSILLAMAGARVIINFNKSKEKAEAVQKEITTAGKAADIFQADVSSPDEITKLFEYIHDKYNGIDILVNNAGIIKDNLLLTMKLSEWDKVMDTNLKGAFLCTKHAAEMMMNKHSGKIINISSIGAHNKHFFHRSAERRPRADKLCLGKGRASLIHKGMCCRAGAERYSGQRGSSRNDRHRHEQQGQKTCRRQNP